MNQRSLESSSRCMHPPATITKEEKLEDGKAALGAKERM
jgi:hypothetical protein